MPTSLHQRPKFLHEPASVAAFEPVSLAGLDKVNPSSVILSGEMMLRHMGWSEAADLVITSMKKTLAQKVVTYDFARLMEGAREVKCSEFGQAMIANM